MTDKIFLKIDGLNSESVEPRHKGEIDVLSWSWGMNQAEAARPGGGGGTDRVNVQDISIIKHCDAATADLIRACCGGRRLREATLTICTAGEKPLEYLQIRLKDVQVTSQSLSSGDGERVTENITLAFAEFTLEYKQRRPNGRVAGTHQAGWNLARNVEV